MADEQRRRRRGRRRGRGGGHPPDRPPEERPEEGQTEEAEKDEPEAPEQGGSSSRRRFFFGRRGDREEEGEERGHREREERQAAGAPAHVSPLSFWRRGRTRTYREQPMPTQTLGRAFRRVRGMYLPPWVPVMFIVVVVFAILGALFFVRSTTGAPRIGDHWHSTYQVFVCGQRQPNVPLFDGPGNNGTHGDGVIHNHPSLPLGEGRGASLVKWFEGGGGKLTNSEMRIPGTRDEYKSGDTCDDGSDAFLQVFANGVKLDDWSGYVPEDGDQVRIIFGPEQETDEIGEADRTVIPESEAARTVEFEVTGAEGDAAFAPDSIELAPGETVKLLVSNTGSISHSVRVAGADGEYGNEDDFVSQPETILPGEEGFLIVRFDEEGEIQFQDPSSPRASGTIVVTGEPAGETPESVDATFDVSMGDNFFEPNELEVEAGQMFRINLTNNGEFIHNLRITGLDGEYETGDDLVSTPEFQRGGETGELVGQIDEPGVYSFRSDSQRTEMTGTITVK